MLMEHETSKLKELDESYAKEFKDWKADLKPRKQVRLLPYLRPPTQKSCLTLILVSKNTLS